MSAERSATAERALEAGAKRWGEATRDRVGESVAANNKNFWERSIDYIAIAFVLVHLHALAREFDFLVIFVVFLGFFFFGYYVSARIDVALRTSASALRSGTFLRTVLQFIRIAIDYATYLTLTALVARATSFVSDGRWTLLNLVLPAAVVAGFLVECARRSL